jgi:hypothetical protein
MNYLLGYAWIPLFTGLVFLGGLVAMLGTWCAQGHPRYQPGESSILYISAVGAHLKPLFISSSSEEGGGVDSSNLCNYSAGICVESGCG